MREAMRYDGIIFDFNGVMVFDQYLVDRAWEVFEHRIRGKGISKQEWHGLHGNTTLWCLRHLLGPNIPESELADLETTREAMALEMYQKEGAQLKFSPGTQELLENLKARGIARAIATSSIGVLVDFFWIHFGLGKWFERDNLIFFDHSFAPKPAPDIYLKAGKAIGVPMERLVIPEDSLPGIAAAVAAGAGLVVGVGPPKNHNKLRRAGARRTIVSLSDLHPEGLF